MPVQVGVVLGRGELDSRRRILAVSEVAIESHMYCRSKAQLTSS